jgi:hypothetical protein
VTGLGRDELAAQHGRARRLAPHLASLSQSPDRLELAFGPGVDAALLQNLLAVERIACPFFRIDHDERTRRVTVSATDERGRPALAALAAAFSR